MAQQVQKEMASGKAYVHSAPDVYGRPAIVIRTKLHVTGAPPRPDPTHAWVFALAACWATSCPREAGGAG